MHLRLLTAGESHGKGITFILSGFPRGLRIKPEKISFELKRRRGGLGRSPRMKLERDDFECLAGLRDSVTTGNPLAFFIANAEVEKWAKFLSPWEANLNPKLTVPRPGHADLPGAIKFGSIKNDRLQCADIRDIIERSSARETVARVLAGVICKTFLDELNINIHSFVFQIGRAKIPKTILSKLLEARSEKDLPLKSIEENNLRIPNLELMKKAEREIALAQKAGTTLGGGFAVFGFNVPIGLGSFSQWDTRLDGLITQAILSIPGVKAVGFGGIFIKFGEQGIKYHGDIVKDRQGVRYTKNSDGGLAGGVSNGMPIVVTALMKPLPTQAKPLRSVDLFSGKSSKAFVERHDVTSVPSASIIAEAMLAIVLSSSILDVFGGDEISQIKERVEVARMRVKNL